MSWKALRTPVQGATPEYERTEKGGVVTQRWTVKDVAPLKRESMLPPLADIVPNVAIMPRKIVWAGVTTIDAANWSGIGRFYWDLAHDRLSPAPEVAEAARSLVQGVTDPDGRLRTLFEFVQGKINYVSISLGVGGWQPRASEAKRARRGVGASQPRASEAKRATRPERAGKAAREGACRGVRGAKPLG